MAYGRCRCDCGSQTEWWLANDRLIDIRRCLLNDEVLLGFWRRFGGPFELNERNGEAICSKFQSHWWIHPWTYFPFSPHPAIHNWHGNVQHGLDLDVGDFVEILEECGPWYRGTCPRKPRVVGIFPKSYIHIKDLTRTDAVVAECTQVLREWSEIWKRLYVVSVR